MLVEKLDEEKRIVILVLDEIDKIVTKNGTTSYTAPEDQRRPDEGEGVPDRDQQRPEVHGVARPALKSRLSDEKMVFRRTTRRSCSTSWRSGPQGVRQRRRGDSVCPYRALAAQEHGDARRAMDLLRSPPSSPSGRRRAHHGPARPARENKIELDTSSRRSSPSDAVEARLLSIISNGEAGRTG